MKTARSSTKTLAQAKIVEPTQVQRLSDEEVEEINAMFAKYGEQKSPENRRIVNPWEVEDRED